MDDQQQGPSVYNRNAAFGEGMTGGQVMPSYSLQQTQAEFNARVPRGYRAPSSGNGMSRRQYEQTLGGAFPNNNGMSADQYEVSKYSMNKGGEF